MGIPRQINKQRMKTLTLATIAVLLTMSSAYWFVPRKNAGINHDSPIQKTKKLTKMSGMNSSQKRTAILMRGNPTYHGHSTLGSCYKKYLSCRASYTCNAKVTPNGNLRRFTFRQKTKCRYCIQEKTTCLEYAKKHLSLSMTQCRTKRMFCKKKCGTSYTCRASCKTKERICIQDVSSPPQYYAALKK